MVEKGEESDYLAGTKPEREEPLFAAAVREAFALEHQCLQDQDIAEHLKVTPGRISQILKKPRLLKAETVQKIIRSISSRAHRKQILKAWQQECFGEDIETATESLLGGAVDDTTIRRIDRLVRQYRPDRALRLTREALQHEVSDDQRRRLMERAFGLALRLEQTADAMAMALAFFEWGKERGDRDMMAVGLSMRARALRTIDGISAQAILDVHKEIIEVAEHLPDIAPTTKYMTPNKQFIVNEEIAVVLRDHEEHGGAEEYLQKAKRLAQTVLRETDVPTSKGGSYHVEARIELALKNYFKAEELVEEGFVAGDLSLAACSKSGILKAKILAARGQIDEAIAYYEELITLCEKERQLRVYKLAQQDLAVLRASKFPPSHPVL